MSRRSGEATASAAWPIIVTIDCVQIDVGHLCRRQADRVHDHLERLPNA